MLSGTHLAQKRVHFAPVCVCKVVPDSLQPVDSGPPVGLLCIYDSLGETTGVGCHALLQGSDLPDPGIESESFMSPALAGRFFTTSATWEASPWQHTPCHFALNIEKERPTWNQFLQLSLPEMDHVFNPEYLY